MCHARTDAPFRPQNTCSHTHPFAHAARHPRNHTPTQLPTHPRIHALADPTTHAPTHFPTHLHMHGFQEFMRARTPPAPCVSLHFGSRPFSRTVENHVTVDEPLRCALRDCHYPLHSRAMERRYHSGHVLLKNQVPPLGTHTHPPTLPIRGCQCWSMSVSEHRHSPPPIA